MPVYEPEEYENVIKRLKGKVALLNINMGKCITEEEIVAFENRNGVTLPQAYRLFLKNVGNGCDSMLDGRRLNALDTCTLQEPSEPFMLSEPWVWEDDKREWEIIKAEMKNRVYRGNMEMINCGCSVSYNLIVTGKCQGEVWNFTDVGVTPCFERQDFLSWFELWLDNQEKTDYFKDFVY